jgi:hypothetical protein
MNSPLGGVKPNWDWLCVHFHCPFPPPPPYHMASVWWELPPPPLFGWHGGPIYTESWARFRQYPESLSHGPVTSLIGSHPSSSSSSATTHPSPTPWERVSWLLFRLSLCPIWVSWVAFGFSLRECCPWVRSPLTWTSLLPGRTIWSEWPEPEGPLS